MTKHNLEQWNQERTEGEIRNWLIANNLWHPEALYAHLDARPAETSSMHAMDRSQAEQLLQTAAVGRLSYQAGEHRVVIPLAYAYADGAIYGALDNSLAALLRDHPRVAFQVEQVTHPLSWQSVVIQGRADVLTDTAADYARGLLASRVDLPTTVRQRVAWVRIIPTDMNGLTQEG
jgi:hypothetical protein